LTVVLCSNCHGGQTEAQRRAGVPLDRRELRSLLERVAALLLGLAALFEQLARRFAEDGNALLNLSAELDERCVGWRTFPTAR
jgi:hypothetical protein